MEQEDTATKDLNASFDAKSTIRAFCGWVRLNLSLSGKNLEDLAKENGIKGKSLGTVFHRPYPRAERIIADALGLRPQDLWPERYGKNGKPNRPNLWYQRKSGAWKPKTDVVTT